MTTAIPTAGAAPRRGARLGAWSLISAAIVLLWVVVMIVCVLLISSTGGATASVAYVMFFAGFVVLPIGFIAVLVLAILALIRNRPLGKVLAGVALLLMLVILVLGMVGLGGSGLFPFFMSI